MKKFLSILLVCALLIGMYGIPAQANEPDSAYPESEHNYANDCSMRWHYVYPEDAEGIFVTFSEDTYTEIGSKEYVPEEDDWNYKEGDWISVYRGDTYEWLGTFQGDQLASKTIYIPASSFRILLRSDESVTAYGFKIERIGTTLPEGVNAVCYNFESDESDANKHYECYETGEKATVIYDIPSAGNINFRNGNEFRSGWSTSPNGELEYTGGEEITTDEKVVNLYSSWVPLSISADEVYSFGNYFSAFDVDPDMQYYMTPEDHGMLLRNALRNGLPGWISYKALKEYPKNNFQGACFGLASTVFLQHHGVIDMLSLQEGAETMRDLDNSPEVISVINYYQSLTILSFLCQNQAPDLGTEEYKKQLKDLFETVSEGKPVLLSLLSDKYIFGNNHSVVVTGAYTDTQGNHYILAYDEEEYAEHIITSYKISPDFSCLGSGDTFYWTDDYSHLESFDINGGGSPIKWYMQFIPQIPALLKMLFQQLYRQLTAYAD